MKWKIFLGLLPFVSLILYACGDDDLLPISCDDSVDTIAIELIPTIKWQVPLNPIDTSYRISFEPLVYDGNALFSVRFLEDWDILYMRDGSTGEQLWRWEDPTETGYSSKVGKSRYQNRLCYTKWGKNYVLDLNTGQVIWEQEDKECGSPRITRLGNFFYTVHQPCGQVPTSVTLVRTDLRKDYPAWDSVYTVYAADNQGYTPSFEMPALWVTPSGDSILYFQNRQIHYSNNLEDRVDLHAYNLSQDRLLWRRDSITPSGNSSVQPPLVSEDKVYFTGERVILCFDALTGELIWKNELGDGMNVHFLLSNMLIADHILVVKNTNDNAYGLNPDTGVEIWRQEEAEAANTSMVYYDGHVYFTGGRYLHKIAVATGEIKWKFKSPMRSQGYYDALFWYTGVAIDPELQHLYTSDGHFIYCFDLAEE